MKLLLFIEMPEKSLFQRFLLQAYSKRVTSKSTRR